MSPFTLNHLLKSSSGGEELLPPGSEALCKAKLENVWGLGRLCRVHYNTGTFLSLIILTKKCGW